MLRSCNLLFRLFLAIQALLFISFGSARFQPHSRINTLTPPASTFTTISISVLPMSIWARFSSFTRSPAGISLYHSYRRGSHWGKWGALTSLAAMGGLFLHPAEAKEQEHDKDLDVSKLKCTLPTEANQHFPSYKPVVLLSCGSFNPPTIMHLRMFDLARDELRERGFDVMGGYISPVHDGYGKRKLADAQHRIEMCKLAVETSDALMVDDWEATAPTYRRIRHVLKRIQEGLNNALGDNGDVPTTKVMLLCGADLLESMCVEGVWRPQDVQHILESNGVVCLMRTGSSIEDKINDKGSCLSKHRDNIIVIEDPMENSISSSCARDMLKAGRSVRYVVPEEVLKYISRKGLYT